VLQPLPLRRRRLQLDPLLLLLLIEPVLLLGLILLLGLLLLQVLVPLVLAFS